MRYFVLLCVLCGCSVQIKSEPSEQIEQKPIPKRITIIEIGDSYKIYHDNKTGLDYILAGYERTQSSYGGICLLENNRVPQTEE